MGSTWQQERVAGKKSEQTAFDELKSELLYNFGHDPYAGHLGLKDYLIVVSPESKSENIEKRLGEYMDDGRFDKWDGAGCMELKGAAYTKWRKRNPAMKGKKGIRCFIFFGWCPE